MRCPKCEGEMQPMVVEGTTVDRCGSCHGLWFDLMEHEELRAFADRVDTGDAVQGAKYNAIDRIQCPSCPGGQPLIRMVDPQQPHIWFESCTVCYGRFYDAGEFRDFAEFGFKDWLKRFRAAPRG